VRDSQPRAAAACAPPAGLLSTLHRSQGGPLSLIPAHKLSVSLGRRFLEQGVTLGGRVQLVAEQGRKAVDAATRIRPQPTPACHDTVARLPAVRTKK
jgi:hypothetical protein